MVIYNRLENPTYYSAEQTGETIPIPLILVKGEVRLKGINVKIDQKNYLRGQILDIFKMYKDYFRMYSENDFITYFLSIRDKLSNAGYILKRTYITTLMLCREGINVFEAQNLLNLGINKSGLSLMRRKLVKYAKIVNINLYGKRGRKYGEKKSKTVKNC